MDEQSKAIFKSKEPRQEALDFHFLKEKAVGYIQELSGHQWTDFNLHDPGVTILDQLCYALTDLGIRTQINFKDLLSSQRSAINHHTFFSASQILTASPWTINDYRRLLLDRFPVLADVYLVPLARKQRQTIQGLYLVLLKCNPEWKRTKASEEKLEKEVKQTLAECRNFGEDFSSVCLMDAQEIFFQMKIRLENNVWAEEVHAQVLTLFERYISPHVKNSGLDEMEQNGIPSEEIFEGPKLLSGFIDKNELKEKRFFYSASDFMKVIVGIKGVQLVENIKLYSEFEQGKPEQEPEKDLFTDEVLDRIVGIDWFKAGKVGRAHFKYMNDASLIKYYKKSVPITLIKEDVLSRIKRLKASRQRRRRGNEFKANDYRPVLGKRSSVHHYTSIQRHFPAPYGLNDTTWQGLSEQKKTEILQLKGFLMLFEQVLANNLAQLADFEQLFSLNHDQKRTFFSQVPLDIPQLHKVFDFSEEQLQENEEYIQEKLEEVLSDLEDFGNRRMAFLRHLMNRFGENYEEFPFYKFDYYPDYKPQSEITNLINLLQHQSVTSMKKACCPEPSPDYWEGTAMSTLEKKLRLKLNLPRIPKRFTEHIFSKVFFKEIPLSEKMEEIFSGDYKFFEDDIVLKGIWEYAETCEGIIDRPLIEEIVVDQDLFRRGLTESRYKLLNIESRKVKRSYLLFQSSDDLECFQEKLKSGDWTFTRKKEEDRVLLFAKDSSLQFAIEYQSDKEGRIHRLVVWRVLGVYHEELQAAQAAYSLQNLLQEWNYKSEGLYVIDHLMLRPRRTVPRYGIQILTGGFDIRLKLSGDLESLQDETVENLLEMKKIGEGEIFDFQDETADTEAPARFGIVWKNASGPLAYSNDLFESRQEAETVNRRVKEYLNSVTLFDIQRKKNIHYFEHPETKEVSDYNFTVSICLPGWTARFSDLEFRHLTEGAIRKNTPAHISLQIMWMDLNEMMVFECLYDKWLGEFRRAESKNDYESFNQVSCKIMKLLDGEYTLDSPMDVAEFFNDNPEK